MTDNIYREELMDIYKHPPNKGSIDNPTVSVWKKNPMCGDEITLQLNVKDGVVEDAKFNGVACSVSTISSALLTEKLKGKTLEEVEKINKEEFLNEIGLNLSTSRVKCATLPLMALDDALKNLKECLKHASEN